MTMASRRVLCLFLVAQSLALSPRPQEHILSTTGARSGRVPGISDFVMSMTANSANQGFGDMGMGGGAPVMVSQPVVFGQPEAAHGGGKGFFGSGLLTNFINDGVKEVHTPLPKGVSKEDQAWWRRMFWYGMFAFFALVGLVVVLGVIFIMTIGRSYFFAAAARARMEGELEAKMPTDIKEYVKSAEFLAKCDRVFREKDPDNIGSVEWTKELKTALLDEYGEEIKDHKYFKEMEDPKWETVDKGVSMDRAAYGELLKWMEFLRQDAANGGIDPNMVTTRKKKPEDEENDKEKGEEKPKQGAEGVKKEAV